LRTVVQVAFESAPGGVRAATILAREAVSSVLCR
jgi:hypothetical protein